MHRTLGDLRPPATAGADPSLRSWQSVHLGGVRRAAQGGRVTPFDGVGSGCLRRLDSRELRLYLEAGADPPSLVAESAERQDGFSAEYVEGFYDTKRRDSALGHLSPSEYKGAKPRGGAVA